MLRIIQWLKGAVVGTLSGAVVGCAVGCLLAWDKVALYGDLATCWRNCGPHVFIPLWMGTVIGFAARVELERESVTGHLLTVAAGMGAGVVAPAAYGYAFGRPYPAAGFAAAANVLPLLLLFCGGVAGIFWRFTFDRFLD